jgi:U-box domain
MTKNNSDDVPEEFRCPITHEVMRNPLVSCYGQSYERNAILTWLEYHNNQCPLTRKTLKISNLIRNRSLQIRIDEWHKARGIPFNDDEEADVEQRILLTCSREDLPSQDSYTTINMTDDDEKGENQRKIKTIFRCWKIKFN